MRMVTGLRRSDFLKLLVKIFGSGAVREIAFSSSWFVISDLVFKECAGSARGVRGGGYFARGKCAIGHWAQAQWLWHMRMVTGLRRSDFLKLLVKILGSGAARGIAFSSW